MPETAHILRLLCTCQPDSIALADALAKGLGIDILELLEQEGFFELGLRKPNDFTANLLEGDFYYKKAISLKALKYFSHLKFFVVDKT